MTAVKYRDFLQRLHDIEDLIFVWFFVAQDQTSVLIYRFFVPVHDCIYECRTSNVASEIASLYKQICCQIEYLKSRLKNYLVKIA